MKLTLVSDGGSDDDLAASPPQEIKINNFEIKQDIDLSTLLNKMFIQWKSLTTTTKSNFEGKEKLEQCRTAMIEFLELGYRAACAKIWNSSSSDHNTTTPIENRVKEYKANKEFVFPCVEFISRFYEADSDDNRNDNVGGDIINHNHNRNNNKRKRTRGKKNSWIAANSPHSTRKFSNFFLRYSEDLIFNNNNNEDYYNNNKDVEPPPRKISNHNYFLRPRSATTTTTTTTTTCLLYTSPSPRD